MKMYKHEADLTKVVKKYLDSLPEDEGHFDKLSDRYHPGISDFIGCYRGRFVAIELKAEDGEPSMHQIKYISDILASGGKIVVAKSLDEVKSLIASIVWPRI